jgi:hypothetical protein
MAKMPFLDKIIFGERSSDKMNANQLIVYRMTIDEMPVHKMIVGDMY